MKTLLIILALTSATPLQAEEEKNWNLLEIARQENQVEQARRARTIREIINQLGIYSDPRLMFVQQKKAELLEWGSLAIPYLKEAMASTSPERNDINAGKVCASILAAIPGPEAEQAGLELLASEHDRTRANAIICLGVLGNSAHIARIKPNLNSKNPTILAATLVSLGRLQTPDLLTLVAPSLQHPSQDIRLAALQALDFAKAGTLAAVEHVIATFQSAGEPTVQNIALGFIEKYGRENAVPVLIEGYLNPALGRRERLKILSALEAVGQRVGKTEQEKIIAFLKTLLTAQDYESLKKAAFILNILGDESGVKILTGNMDRLIAKHGKAEYLFKRAEIFLQFNKYKEARHDFLEGLRKDKKAERYGSQRVYLALARCYAAEERYPEAERYLKKAKVEDPAGLLEDYGEFGEMAADGRYADLFQKGKKR